MPNEIFVVKDNIFRALMEYSFPDYPHGSVCYYLTLEGKRIVSRTNLLNYCIGQAEIEMWGNKKYQEEVKKRAIKLCKEFKFIKNKRSKFGKWVRKAMNTKESV